MAKKKVVNFTQLQKSTEDFLSGHKTEIQNVTRSHNNIFEVSCFVVVAQYYERIGYHFQVKNPVDGKFRFRYSTNGYPWRYSYLAGSTEENGQPAFEIWHNQKVAGWWVKEDVVKDFPLFALDIAVVKPGSLPANLNFDAKGKNERVWVKNEDLITFGEAKNLVGYPMLIAQFLGVVHELKPYFLHERDERIPSDFYENRHLPPSLITSGNMLSGALRVIKSFEDRKIELLVIDNLISRAFDHVLNQLSQYTEKYVNRIQKADAIDNSVQEKSRFSLIEF